VNRVPACVEAEATGDGEATGAVRVADPTGSEAMPGVGAPHPASTTNVTVAAT
jgi:hypothetical protein